jgi:glycosidase
MVFETMSIGNRQLLALAAVLASLTVSPALRAQDFKKQVIYQIVTDRFVDGDPSNDNPPQSPNLFDPAHTQWRMYWGGDFAGIEQKLPYLQGMGVTAIWISPPVDNINVGFTFRGEVSTAYHGYYARDMKRLEEHFGDASNGWTAFDRLVAAAHQAGIKMIVDFAPNHTNPNNLGEYGAFYDDGRFIGDYRHDPEGYFHHTPSIRNYDDRYEVQYDTLADLADLNQENPVIDAYLKDAVRKFQQHGVDGFRFDAVKHVTWGWENTLANAAHSYAPCFLFGEWFEGSIHDALYPDSAKFANHSGMSILDYPLASIIREVFGHDRSFSELTDTLAQEDRDFRWPNDLVTFVDNHDLPRLLSLRNSPARLEEAQALVMLMRGIPIVYYGDEQYLHNDTEGGGDPYTRLMMASFDTTSRMYRLVRKLAALRRANPALAYGGTRVLRAEQDALIFERRFAQNVVLTAINKNDGSGVSLADFATGLPAGRYADYLKGEFGGGGIVVKEAGQGSGVVQPFLLPAHAVAVWQAGAEAAGPDVGSIEPTTGQPGMMVTIAGQGFGAKRGAVLFGDQQASVSTWSDTMATLRVPVVPNGIAQVVLATASGRRTAPVDFTVLAARQIPVTFTVHDAPPTAAGEYLFLSGNTVELGQGGATFDTAIGPMLDPKPPDWFIAASMPGGVTIEFKFLRIAADGQVSWESGPKHTYRVPQSGVGKVDVDWKYR